MKIISPLLLLFFFAFSSSSEKIRHDQHQALTWEDFKGRPDRSSPYYASTASGYEFEMEVKKDSLVIFLPCYFEKKDSWVKKGEGTPELLAHEQLHFDITELHVRKMRKAFKELGTVSLKSINKVAEKIIKTYSKESSKRQSVYDRETNHSIKVLEQKRWEEEIKEEMKGLAAFTNPLISLPIAK